MYKVQRKELDILILKEPYNVDMRILRPSHLFNVSEIFEYHDNLECDIHLLRQEFFNSCSDSYRETKVYIFLASTK